MRVEDLCINKGVKKLEKSLRSYLTESLKAKLRTALDLTEGREIKY